MSRPTIELSYSSVLAIGHGNAVYVGPDGVDLKMSLAPGTKIDGRFECGVCSFRFSPPDSARVTGDATLNFSHE